MTSSVGSSGLSWSLCPSGALEQSLDPTMTEWERSREREEFVRASILYRPSSSSLSSRFTRAQHQEDEDSVEVSLDQEVGPGTVPSSPSLSGTSKPVLWLPGRRGRQAGGRQDEDVRQADQGDAGVASRPAAVQEVQRPRPVPRVRAHQNQNQPGGSHGAQLCF